MLLMAVNVFFGVELTGKVDSNRREEASTQKRCLFKISVKQMSVFNSSKIAFRWIAKTGEPTITVSTHSSRSTFKEELFNKGSAAYLRSLLHVGLACRFSTIHQSHAYMIKP